MEPQRTQRGRAATKRKHPLPTLPPRGGGRGWGGKFLIKIKKLDISSAEKHSVSSKKQIKKLRLGMWEKDAWLENEFGLGYFLWVLCG
jgi:hypothetical protein